MARDLTETWLRKQLTTADRLREDVGDSRQQGLTVRIAPTGISWWYRTKSGGVPRRQQLGTYPQLALADARRLAAAASDVVRRGVGEPDDVWVVGKRIELGIDTLPIAPPRPPRTRSKWTFAKAREVYLEEVGRTRRPATKRSYGEFLRHPALRHLDVRPVAEISRQELAEVLAAVHRAGGETQSKNMAAALRPMWTFLALDHVVASSGVEPEAMVRLKAPDPSRISRGKRVERDPDVARIGRVLAIARSGLLHPVMASAIELVCLTAQRRLTIVSAMRSCIREENGHFVWVMPAETMKAGETRRGRSGETISEHELSLPETARTVVERMLTIETDSTWLFPGVRPRRKGDVVGHVHASSLTHAIAELPNSGFSPHDIRRAFTSTLRAAGYPRDSAALILDHAEGRTGVTTRHYDRYRELDEKLEKLTVWSDVVETAAAEAATSLDLCSVKDHLRTVRLKRASKGRATADGRRRKSSEAC